VCTGHYCPEPYIIKQKHQRVAGVFVIPKANNQTIKQSNNQTIKQSNNQTIKQSNNQEYIIFCKLN